MLILVSIWWCVCVNRKPFANPPPASPVKGDNMSVYFCSSSWSHDMNEHNRPPSSDRQPERSKPNSTCSWWIWICLSNATLMLRCGIFSVSFVFLIWRCRKNIEARAMLCLQETLGCFPLLLPFGHSKITQWRCYPSTFICSWGPTVWPAVWPVQKQACPSLWMKRLYVFFL